MNNNDLVASHVKRILYLEDIIIRARRLLLDLIDGGEECRGHDSQISEIIRILEGESR